MLPDSLKTTIMNLARRKPRQFTEVAIRILELADFLTTISPLQAEQPQPTVGLSKVDGQLLVCVPGPWAVSQVEAWLERNHPEYTLEPDRPAKGCTLTANNYHLSLIEA